MKQPSRHFPFDKFQPEKCVETEMISYLLDCYDRVHLEERMAPKVSFRNNLLSIFLSHGKMEISGSPVKFWTVFVKILT